MHIFITGARRGIGQSLKEIASHAKATLVTPMHEDCDLTSEKSVSHYITASLTNILPFDACVFNAHTWFSKPLAAQSLKDLDMQWAYVKHHWLLMQHLLLHNYTQCVVIVSSLRGLVGGVNSGPYSMAKAAMINMVLGFNKEYPGVRFHAVCPGLTATDMEKEVRETGGVSNPSTIAQPPISVAQVVWDIIVGKEKETIICINQKKREIASWNIR